MRHSTGSAVTAQPPVVPVACDALHCTMGHVRFDMNTAA
jgi:hypothetical protein